MLQKLSSLLFLLTFSITVFSMPVDSSYLQTPEGVAAKSIEFISFEKGEVKDWDEFRNLYLPNAHKLVYRPKDGRPLFQQANDWNVEEFVQNVGPRYPEKGFEEYVIGVEVNEFNGIATVFQSFYCRALDGSYESRGVNAYQMVYLENRWWIAFTTYTDETPDMKLPNELLFEKYQTKD